MKCGGWKFRGWDATGRKGWVYGDLVHNMGISEDPKVDLYPRVMVGGYEVIPESVGLFSGRKDSDGKEIYQGDIVLDGCGFRSTVVWDDGDAGLYLLRERLLQSFSDGWMEHIKVVGNVFEENLACGMTGS